MREYELTVIFHPDLEMNVDPALDKVHKLIEANGGQIIKEETEPKRRMMYSIKGQNFGLYYFFLLSLPPEAPNKIENTLSITDEVLRHLLVKPDPRRAQSDAMRKEHEGKPEEDSEAPAKTTEATNEEDQD